MTCETIQEIRILRGSTKVYRLTVTDDDDELVNLTGARVVMTVRNQAGGVQLFAKDSNVGIAQVEILVQSGVTLGMADIKVGPSDTAAATPGNYVYDVWVILPSGARHAAIRPSLFYIEQAITELP